MRRPSRSTAAGSPARGLPPPSAAQQDAVIQMRSSRPRRGSAPRSPRACRPQLLALEDRLAPASLTLSGGVVGYDAADGEANDLTVSAVTVSGQAFLRFEERGAGVTITPIGSGLVVVSPGVVLVPAVGVTQVGLR